jgi:hypothetical protein
LDLLSHLRPSRFDAINRIVLELWHFQATREDPELHQAVLKCKLAMLVLDLLKVEPFDEESEDIDINELSWTDLVCGC